MAEESDQFVALGDLITLFCVDTKGYVFSNDVSDIQNGVIMHADQNQDKPEGILDSSMCQFRVCIQNRYKLTKKYKKLLAQAQDNEDPEFLNQLRLAKTAAEAEAKDNSSETENLLGQRLVYGDTVQLFHVWSGKYVHISTVTGSVKDQDNMLVYLNPNNSKSCQFKILPRYKVKSDGDTIQRLDHVMFESVKMPGHYLHASRSWQINKFSFGSELNMGVNRSGFIMSVSARPTPAFKDQLKFGDSIQLYHRELESHLLIQGGFHEEPVKDSLYFELKEYCSDSLRLVSESGSKFWTIENATNIVSAEPIRWGQPVLIRHRITHRYLCLNEKMNVTTTKSGHDPRAVFTLNPVKKGGEYISKNTLGRIQHEITGYCIRTLTKRHGRNDDLAVTTDDDDLTVSTTLSATPEEQYHDAFVFLSVQEKDVLRFNYVAGLVPFFATFNEQLMKNGVMRQTEKNILVLMLKELDEHFRADEGTETMQCLLRNFKLVDILLALMKFPPPEKPAARQMVYDVMIACYVVMQAYLGGKNRENAEYLFKDIDFFYGQLENPNGLLSTSAALTMTAMLNDNRGVLGELEESNIRFIVDLVKRTKNPLHLDILSAMCVCQDRGLMKNQTFMAETLIAPDDSPLYRFAFGSECDMTPGNEIFLRQEDGKWEKLSSFVQAGLKGDRAHEYHFFVRQLRLMARICHGSNTAVIKLILKQKQLINWKIMFECLKKTSLPGDIRAAFCRLIEGACILDGISVLATDTLSYSFQYDIIGRSDPIQRKEGGTDKEGNHEGIKMQAFLPLRKWVVAFLEANAVVDNSKPTHNELVAEVVVLADAMLNFGYFGGRDDLQQLIAAVVSLLDGRTDIPRPLEKTKKGTTTKKDLEVLGNFRHSDRFESGPHNASTVTIKTVCLRILETVFKYQYHATLTTLIHKFKLVHTNAWVPKQRMGETLNRLVQLGNRRDIEYITLLEEKLGDIFHRSSFFNVPLLTDILFDLSNYENADLMIKSVSLLNLLYTSDEKLFTRAGLSQILLTEESRRMYKKAQERVPMLRLLTAGILDDHSAKRAARAMHEISKACILKKEWDLPHEIAQKIYINHGLLSVLYDLLRQYSDVDLRRQSRIVVKLLRHTLVLLSTLCNRCPEAQKRTFEKLDLLLGFHALAGDVGLVLQKMFRGNEQLCLSISPEKIQEIVRLAGARREKAASVVAALQYLMQGESEKLIIPRNQDIVMKAIMHDYHNVAYLLDKPREVKEDVLMGTYGNEHRHYLLTLVNLLATAAEGTNILIESLCQKYITLDDTLSVLNNDRIDWHHKAPYMRFLETAYMDTIASPNETGASELTHSSGAWEFMERILTVMVELKASLQAKKEIIDPLLSMVTNISNDQTTRSRSWESHAVDQNDRTETLQYRLRCYFFGIVPFLQSYMSKFFERDDTNFPHEIEILNKIAKRSLELAEEARPCIYNENYMKTLVTGVTCVAKHSSSIKHQDVLDFLQKIKNMTSLKEGESRCTEEIEYEQYFQAENDVNQSFSVFGKNLSIVYGGTNTIQSQLGPYMRKKIPKDKRMKEYSPEGPEALPLGPEFQQFVNVHIIHDARTLEERYKRACKLFEVMSLTQSLKLSRHHSRDSCDEKNQRIDEDNLRCLQILRAILHNEIIFLPDVYETAQSDLKMIRNIQDLFVGQDLFTKIQWLMGCDNRHLAMEVLTFFSKVFFNANKTAQTALMTFFAKSSEEIFFRVATDIINDARFQIREIRTLHLQKQRQMNVAHDSTLSECLMENIHFFSPKGKDSIPLVEKKRIRWWYSPKKKQAIRQARAQKAGTVETFQNAAYSDECESLGDSEPDYSEVMGRVTSILLLVGQTCDGQNKVIQDYMREQLDNVKSFNLVSCIGNFLASIYTTFGPNSIQMITQVLDTMNELATGNLANQRAIHQTKIIDQLNYMLRSGEISSCGQEEGLEFLETMIKLLRTITEENQPDTVERCKSLAHSLDSGLIIKIFTECYVYSMPEEHAKLAAGHLAESGTAILPRLERVDRNKELRERVSALGFFTYFFMRRIMEGDGGKHLVEEMRTESRIAFNYYKKKSMAVELVKDGYVNKVYFRNDNPEILRDDVIEKIRWDIDRTSYNSKIRDLMSWRRGILQDMKYQRKLMNSNVIKFFMKLWAFFVYSNILLTIILCAIILYEYTPPLTVDQIANLSSLQTLPAELFGTNHPPLELIYTLTHGGDWLTKVEFVVAALHVITAFMVVFSYFLRNQPYLPDVSGFIAGLREKARRIPPEEIREDEPDEVEEKSLGTPIIGFTTLYYLIFLGCSVAGLLYSNFFFSFHLFNIISVNQILKRVIQAVTQNGVSLIWVTVLGVAILYVYTLIVYTSFRVVMDPSENWHCARMYECFVSIIYHGLLGGFSGMAIPDQDKSFDHFGWYFLLHVSFFILISTIGLNIIFGIIVDTFSELRDLKWTAEKDMNEICTICDIENFEFDNRAKGFWYHINKEHYIWGYMFYFLYLSETNIPDYTSIELHVHTQLENKQTDFFPNGKALSLMAADDEDEDKLDKLTRQIDEILARQRARESEERRREDRDRRRTWGDENRPIYATPQIRRP